MVNVGALCVHMRETAAGRSHRSLQKGSVLHAESEPDPSPRLAPCCSAAGVLSSGQRLEVFSMKSDQPKRSNLQHGHQVAPNEQDNQSGPCE